MLRQRALQVPLVGRPAAGAVLDVGVLLGDVGGEVELGLRGVLGAAIVAVGAAVELAGLAQRDGVALGRHGGGALLDAAQVPAGFLEELADRPLGFEIVAFAEMLVADAHVRGDQIFGRPVAIVEGAPGAEVVVLRDHVLDAVLLDRLLDVGAHFLELELGRVHADES